tara:strand:- start:1144 stop:1788 length:645 start_codon:yes stop_codon:yes gene_type:complete
MSNRNYPNDYFAWYNDDDRLALVALDTTSTSGEKTKEKYDTFQGEGNLSGAITAFTDYTSTVSGTTKITDAAHGLETGDRITIASSPDAYYDTASSNSDGNYEITKIDNDNFYISATFSAEDSGTWTSLFVDKGLRITYHSFYDTPSSTDDDLESDLGLTSGLHNALICYIKARLYEDQGDLNKAQYFRQMYEKMVNQYPSRKSGVRVLSVPHM